MAAGAAAGRSVEKKVWARRNAEGQGRVRGGGVSPVARLELRYVSTQGAQSTPSCAAGRVDGRAQPGLLTETKEKLLPSTFTRWGPSDAIACETHTKAPKLSNTTTMQLWSQKLWYFFFFFQKPFLLPSSPQGYPDPAACRRYTAVAVRLR